MLTALCEKLAIDPCMRLKDTVAFLHSEFEVDVNCFSIRRALKKDVSWSKKATQNIAQERNQDLRDEYMYEVSSFRPCQLVFLDELEWIDPLESIARVGLLEERGHVKSSASTAVEIPNTTCLYSRWDYTFPSI